MKIRLAGITHESLVDGPGLRTVIWSQGCPHACPGCHNQHTQEMTGGEEQDLEKVFREIDSSLLAQGVTLSGGEPFLQPEANWQIAEYARQKKLSVWAYTGFTFEQLLGKSREEPAVLKLLQRLDVLVDGPFIAAEKDLGLVFRGSRNQRLIDVPRSLRKQSVVVIPDSFFRQPKIAASF